MRNLIIATGIAMFLLSVFHLHQEVQKSCIYYGRAQEIGENIYIDYENGNKLSQDDKKNLFKCLGKAGNNHNYWTVLHNRDKNTVLVNVVAGDVKYKYEYRHIERGDQMYEELQSN